MSKRSLIAMVLSCGTVLLGGANAHAQAPRFQVTIPASARSAPLTGRVTVVITKAATPEPRLAISPRGVAIYAVDVEQLAPGKAALLTDTVIGYPVPLSKLPKGEYHAQAVINVYEQVRRSDGHTIWLPMNDGQIDFYIGFLAGIKAFTAAVLGGIGSLPGAMVGGLLIGLIEVFWSGYFSVEYKDVATFSILVMVLIFRPTGLLGRPDLEKV